MNDREFDCKGFTPNAEEKMQQYDPQQITEVIAKKNGVPCDVLFIFADGSSITILDGYNIGYGGTGPTALYRILISAGFSEEEANSVFKHGTSYIHLTK